MDETFDRNHLLKQFALNEQTKYSQEWNKNSFCTHINSSNIKRLVHLIFFFFIKNNRISYQKMGGFYPRSP
ncbi:hypothetical protein MtrunA17_Chr2g0317341 [Medicago truncatula]|uniref:Uncharacterized protein n=1 Tax=Medicago truncatula TaxID=3880 RepID=A0A396JJ44_MEDTR|nr:hypothetical protein MtrunA17_Chr2g0317341 [Medicago truncatula]